LHILSKAWIVIMKKTILFVILILIGCNSRTQDSRNGQTIEEILQLPEEDIDVGIASLVLAKEFYPEMDIDFFLCSFDSLADRFNKSFGQYTDPDQRIRALNTFLYKPGIWNKGITFSYDNDDLEARELNNRFINGYIATKKGPCITMPLLYVILGERLGWHIYPVLTPKHFFLRYVPEKPIPGFQGNIETTNGGGYFSDEQYQADLQIPKKAIENGTYLRNLSKKEYLASLLLISAVQHLENDNVEKGKEYLKLCMKYDSTLSLAYWNYAKIHLAEARKAEDESYSEQLKETISFCESLNIKLPKIQEAENKKSVKYSGIELSDKNMLGDLLTKITQTKGKEAIEELNNSLIKIREKYKPLILSKMEIYKENKEKAEQLGVVLEFSPEFLEKQAGSIEMFKEKGGY